MVPKGNMSVPGDGMYKQVWKKNSEEGDYSNHDLIVKADADAVCCICQKLYEKFMCYCNNDLCSETKMTFDILFQCLHWEPIKVDVSFKALGSCFVNVFISFDNVKLFVIAWNRYYCWELFEIQVVTTKRTPRNWHCKSKWSKFRILCVFLKWK